MNVRKEYNNEAERILTPPLLLLHEDVTGTISGADKAVLKKTNDKITFAPRVSFAQKPSTGTETK